MMLLSRQLGSTERTLKSFLSAFSKSSRMSIHSHFHAMLQTEELVISCFRESFVGQVNSTPYEYFWGCRGLFFFKQEQ